VPIYQELARPIGLERYRVWLARPDFGNRQIGTVVDTFWLDGPLEISAVEEARFAALLAQQKLDACRTFAVDCPRNHKQRRDYYPLRKNRLALLEHAESWMVDGMGGATR
jgi:hypothetical protein